QTKRLTPFPAHSFASLTRALRARPHPLRPGGTRGAAKATRTAIQEQTMATISTNQFRPGVKIMVEGDPCNIIENEFVKPGKGQAFNRVNARNLLTVRVIEKNIRSGDTFETADVVDTEMQYLYKDGDGWHFMDPATYEQYQVNEAGMGDASLWVKDQDI